MIARSATMMRKTTMTISKAIKEIEDEIERARPTWLSTKEETLEAQAYIQGLKFGLNSLKQIRREFEEWLNQ